LWRGEGKGSGPPLQQVLMNLVFNGARRSQPEFTVALVRLNRDACKRRYAMLMQ